MNLIISSVLLIISHVQFSNEQCLSENDGVFNSSTGLYHGEQAFSLHFLVNANQFKPEDNLFISPYSTFHAILLAYFISSGQTEHHLKKLLRFDDSQEKNNIFNEYKLNKNRTLSDKNDFYEFTNANTIYVSDQIEVKYCISEIFTEELVEAPFFSDPDGARITINTWVQQHTHNMIKEFLPRESLDNSTTIALVNAAYFKGKWVSKFKPEDTKSEIFYITPSKETTVEMMHVKDAFKHSVSSTLGVNILELPYEGFRISMYVLLPPSAKEDAINTILKKLTVEELQNIIQNRYFREKIVHVSFPKFSIEQELELVPILEEMGIGDMFKSTSNFSRLSTDRVDFTNGIHKAKIEVNEEGTKDAAATVSYGSRSRSDPIDFRCDYPFIYFIVDKVKNVILFVGIFRKPE